VTSSRQWFPDAQSGVRSGHPRWLLSAAAGVALAVVMTSAAAAVPASESDVGAAITTRVFDRATGEPVQGVCVLAMPVLTFSLPNACPSRSGGGGRVTVEVPGPGQYNLFALPKLDSPYGAQWVGPDGGTGAQKDARRLTLAAGETKSAPHVLLDPRAMIRGQLMLRSGVPVDAPAVAIAAPAPGARTAERQASVGDDGSFMIDWVGPYGWPLLFWGDNFAFQWSGDSATRVRADPVLATVGESVPVTHFLRHGARFQVRIHSGPIAADRQLVVYNAGTGEHVGTVTISGQDIVGRLRISGGQQVKMQCHCARGELWYGGTDFATAIPIKVGHTELLLLDLCDP